MRFLIWIPILVKFTCLQADPRFQQETPTIVDVPRMEEVLYDSGVQYFRLRNFDSCQVAFQTLVDSFPKSVEAEKAGYMLGYLHTCSDNPRMDYPKARKSFEQFLQSYPDSRFVSDTRSWLRAFAVMDSLEKQIALAGKKSNQSALLEENRRLKSEIDELRQVISRLEKVIKKN